MGERGNRTLLYSRSKAGVFPLHHPTKRKSTYRIYKNQTLVLSLELRIKIKNIDYHSIDIFYEICVGVIERVYEGGDGLERLCV